MSIAVAVKHMLAAGMDHAAIVEAVAEMESTLSCDTQAERRRAADRERKRSARLRNSAESADAPVPPFSDKENPPTPPKEINSTPLTPQTTLLGEGAKIDFDRLTSQIEAVCNGKIQPHSLIVVGPIAEMIASGVSLELDVLPTIKAVASRLNKTVNLSYFLGPIREAYEKRIGAVVNLPKPKEIDESETAWAKRLRFARDKRIWSTAELGPPPGRPGCRVPAALLLDGDGEGWKEIENRSAA